MSVHRVTIDDTRVWVQPSDREIYIGDVLDVATSATTRVRFARYGRDAAHEWIVTHDETLIVTKGALEVRSAGAAQVARAGEVKALGKGARVVFRGVTDDTEVVFVTHVHAADAWQSRRPERADDGRGRDVPRLVPAA
jgi:ethanolamine utilization protein EutQ (cupin superfamily)